MSYPLTRMLPHITSLGKKIFFYVKAETPRGLTNTGRSDLEKVGTEGAVTIHTIYLSSNTILFEIPAEAKRRTEEVQG